MGVDLRTQLANAFPEHNHKLLFHVIGRTRPEYNELSLEATFARFQTDFLPLCPLTDKLGRKIEITKINFRKLIHLRHKTLGDQARAWRIIKEFGDWNIQPRSLRSDRAGPHPLLFGLPPIFLSQHVRSGPAQFLSEFIATLGLVSVIWGCSRSRSNVVPFAVGAYITAAYWFTASTSFANPAVTIARSLSDTFAGIRPADAPLFIAAQVLGALAATFLFRWLVPTLPSMAKGVLVKHDSEN
jgi:hypothetical protein